MEPSDIVAGFGAIYLILLLSMTLMLLLKRPQAADTVPDIQLPVVKERHSPMFVGWAHCDTGGMYGSWAAVSCGDDPQMLADLTALEFPPDTFDVLVLPTNDKPWGVR